MHFNTVYDLLATEEVTIRQPEIWITIVYLQ